MPRALTAAGDIAEEVRRLKELSKDVARTREEHRRHTSEVAQIAIKLKERLDYGQYQAVMRECGFNLKTLEGWVLRYRRVIGEAPPRQSRRERLDEVHPSEPRKPLSLQGSAGTAFDPDAEADAEEEAAWDEADFDDDDELNNEPDGSGEDEVDQALPGAAMLLVNSGEGTPADGAPRGGGASPAAPVASAREQRSANPAAVRAQQLTLDELYHAAEVEAQRLMQLIHARALTSDQIAEFRAMYTRLTAGEAS